MATFSGSEKNKILIEKAQKAIDIMIAVGKNLPEDTDKEEGLVATIDGKKIDKSEIERYKKLKRITEILSFEEKSDSELYAFEEIYVERSKQKELFELANDKEVGIDFPNAFGQYGEIPGTDGLECPRPKSLLETFEAYEAYLKQYYKDGEIDATYDENGVRMPYPHEKYEWTKGVAKVSADKDYVSSYYKDFKDWKSKGNAAGMGDSGSPATGNENKNPEGNPDLTEEERRKRAEERTNKRKGLDRRKYPKGKKSIWDYIKNPFNKDGEDTETTNDNDVPVTAGNKPEKQKPDWKKIKRILVGAALAVGAVVVLQTVGAPIVSALLTGLTKWPWMIGAAVSGVATHGGAAITLTIGERIAMGLIGAAVPLGIFGTVRAIAKKWKAKKQKGKTPEEIEEPIVEPGDDKDKDKGKDKGKGTPTGPELNLPEGSLNDKVTFIKNALTKINNDLDEALEEQRALDVSVASPDLKEEQLKALSARIKDLKAKRNAYIEELTKLVSDAEFEAAQKGDEPAAIHTGGGMNK